MVCCFTGYRPEKMPFPFDKKNKVYCEFEEKLYAAVRTAAENGFTTFYSGGAMGFDIVAAEAVLAIKKEFSLRLIIAVPHRAQANTYSPEWLLRYRSVLSRADEIIYVSDNYSRDCFQKRNQYMVDRSDCVITFFDGQKGGTANTLRYAHHLDKQIINLYAPAQMEMF